MIVIGGGPAGAATAGYLAQAGVSCLVLERETFPRPHVGESLVPATTRVFRELGFIEKMEQGGFPRKFGSVWTLSSWSQSYELNFEGVEPDYRVDIRFDERAQAGVDRPYTWHVDRAKFDLLLLEHAQTLGARVRQAAAATAVDFSEPGRVIVRAVSNGREEALSCRLVVDASGRRTLLGAQLGLKVMDPVFDQFAAHSWFEGYDRGGSEQRDYIHIHFLPESNSWVWQIPITETTTSIGVVTPKRLFAGRAGSREERFWAFLAGRPELRDKVKASRQLRPLKEEGDYSYSMRELCGDRYLLVGDACRFVDPIFSSGVSIALNSARLAAADAVLALRGGDLSRKSFSRFESTLKRGVRNWHEFITLYYRLNIVFASFIKDPRYRLDLIKLIQGDLYDEDEPAVLAEMKRFLSEVEADPKHAWHRFLNDMSAQMGH